MNIPKQITVVENRLGEKEFILKVDHTFVGGIILLMFSWTWLSILAVIAMNFALKWAFTWKNVAIGGVLFVFSGVGLGIFYLSLFCWFGEICIKIKNGVFCYYAGIFGLGRRVVCSLSDIQDISIQRRERKDKWRRVINYHLILQLRNGGIKQVPFGNDEASAKFFAEYITENL